MHEDAVKKAIDKLQEMLDSENEGFRLEAAREILKYSAAMNN